MATPHSSGPLAEHRRRARAHDILAPDLPRDDDSLALNDYADAAVKVVGDRRDLATVVH
jgi:hypothetical protein